ncbi:hypothetical protein ES288_A06G133800v1 [Gossypium darwinii]|uniref:Uncharacterized protein n=1 Tax=Gossypium darwinii TaxID=34276 RepID=A0A5D2G614_GOSDA|nr:hypothetical protein ES288_A06G133800v1 [Gossypium darwinii]
MDALISLVLCYYFSVVPCIVFKLFPPLNFLYRNLKLLLEIMSAASIMHLSLSLFCFCFFFEGDFTFTFVAELVFGV